jgi:hypothetical protein
MEGWSSNGTHESRPKSTTLYFQDELPTEYRTIGLYHPIFAHAYCCSPTTTFGSLGVLRALVDGQSALRASRNSRILREFRIYPPREAPMLVTNDDNEESKVRVVSCVTVHLATPNRWSYTAGHRGPAVDNHANFVLGSKSHPDFELTFNHFVTLRPWLEVPSRLRAHLHRSPNLADPRAQDYIFQRSSEEREGYLLALFREQADPPCPSQSIGIRHG